MEKEDFTPLGKIRLTLALLLFLVALLILAPAPTYTLWKLEVAATEWAHYIALLALALLVPGWRYGRYSIVSAIVALFVFCISCVPLIRAMALAEDLPANLAGAFGLSIPRGIKDAPAFRKPITLRLLFQNRAAPNVDVVTIDYASRTFGFLQLDLYKSTALPGQRPLVIVVHGGSWSGGDKADLSDLNYYLASRGYYVAALDYRFAPEFPNPAATEDLNAAIAFFKTRGPRLGIDPSRIALVGRSAGGHLALLTAYTLHDPDIRGVVALYPPTDQLYGYQNPSSVIPSQEILSDYLGGTPVSKPREYIANSPIHFVGRDTPPTLLIHGSKDELVSVRQSQMLDERLAANDRPHMLLELPWATHGCDYVFNGPCGQLSTYAIERFLASVLR